MSYFDFSREKPYGTIVEGSVGYQEDTYHHASQVVFDSKKCDEKTLLVPNNDVGGEKSMDMLTPFSGQL